MILRRSVPRQGLSLIEVLLSLTILVIALGAIGHLVDIGTDRGNDARAYNRGTRLAQSKMAEVEAGLISLTGETSGQFTNSDDAGWSYTVTAQASGPPNLHTVTVTVSTTISGRPITITLTQMIFDPTLLGSSSQAEATSSSSSSGTTGTTGSTGMTGSTSTGTGGTSP